MCRHVPLFLSSKNTFHLLTVCLLLGWSMLSPVCGLRFYLIDRERACFFISAPQQSLIRGEATLENGPGSAKIFVEISHGSRMIYERHDSQIGKFSAMSLPAQDTTMEKPAYAEDNQEDLGYQHEAIYKACVLLTAEQGPELHHRVKRAVTFKLNVPMGADDENPTKGNVRAEHVDSASQALKDMLNHLHGMVTDLTALQSRERKLVARNERTASHLGQLTIVSILVLLATSSFQFANYKQYFKSKKLC